MTENESFVFYKSMFEAIEQIPDTSTQAQAYRTLAVYGLFGVEPPEDVPPFVQIIFKQAKPILDKSMNRYRACVMNGKKGGAPKGNQNAKRDKTTENNQTNNQRNNQTNNLKTTENNLNYNYNLNYNKEKERIEKEKTTVVSNFLLSLKNKYPNLNTDVNQQNLLNYDYDLEKINKAIEKSEWLQNASIDFVLQNYAKVISGAYDSFTIKSKPGFKQRQYTKEEVDALFDNLDEIDLGGDENEFKKG